MSFLTNFLVNPFGGDVKVCNQCGFGELIHKPEYDTIEKYYRWQYWHEHAVGWLDDRDFSKYPRAKGQFDFVKDVILKPKQLQVLDIGAGHAHTTQLIRVRRQELGLTTELNACEAGERCKPYYMTQNIALVAQDFPFESTETYDYIHASHWFEHALDPLEVITAMRSMLVKNGFVFVEVPNTTYDYWNSDQLDSPHTLFFTPTSLSQLFTSNGFSVLRLGTYGPSILERVKPSFNKGAVDFQDTNPSGCWIRALFQKC